MFSKTEPSSSRARDILNLAGFIAAIVVGAWLINIFLFRSFNVTGPSMEPTMFTGDRLIVNRLPTTWATITRESYLPERGQIIVFENPLYDQSLRDRYIVKRVIGLPGERVVLEDGEYTVYNDAFPAGFNPDEGVDGPKSPTDGDYVDRTVPEGEIFVSGDNREGQNSFDSRNGLGTVPLSDVIGPVSFRIFPFTEARTF